MNIHKCDDCGSNMSLKDMSPYSKTSKALGEVHIPFRVDAFVCENSVCKSISWPLKSIKAVEQYVDTKLKETINNLPVGDFISEKEAAAIIDVSKQAINKNLTFKKGVYSHEIDGRIYYYKKSVEAFARTGDGRISLEQQPEKLFTGSFAVAHWIQASYLAHATAVVKTRITATPTLRTVKSPFLNLADFHDDDFNQLKMGSTTAPIQNIRH